MWMSHGRPAAARSDTSLRNVKRQAFPQHVEAKQDDTDQVVVLVREARRWLALR